MIDAAELARRANEASDASRRRGAPQLRANSSYDTLLDWLLWADPNGIWGSQEELDDAELDVDDLWEAVEQVMGSW
jgi:hypothetical protein